MRRDVLWALVGIAAIGAWLWFNSRPAVVAKTNSGFINTGVVAPGSKVEVAIYDAAEERHRRVQTFAGSASRLCQRYLNQVSGLTLQSSSGQLQPVPDFMFDGLPFEPELAEAMGVATYQRIASEERRLRSLAGDLMQSRQQYAAGRAFASATGRVSVDGQATAASINTLQNELLALTQEHCSFLSGLTRSPRAGP